MYNARALESLANVIPSSANPSPHAAPYQNPPSPYVAPHNAPPRTNPPP
ncbi:MAG: hypothetical protein QXV41_05420 [Zestosphaera sp.]